MRRNTFLKSAGVLLIVTAISLPLLAGPFGHRMRGGHGVSERQFAMLAEELKLTKDQTSKMTAARDAFQLAMIELRSNLAKQRLELRAALRDGSNTPEQKVAELFQQEADIKAKIALERYRHRMSVRGALTPEQQKKMESLMSERRKGMGSRMHGKHMMGDDDFDTDIRPGRGPRSRGL